MAENVSQTVASGPIVHHSAINEYDRPTTNLPDFHWNLQHAVDRFVWVNTFSVSVSSPGSTLITSIPLNGDALSDALSVMPYTNFIQVRGGAKIRIDVAGTKFHTGALLAGFSITGTPTSIDCLFGGTHALIDVSGMSTTTLEYPYWNPFEAIPANIGNEDSYGTFYMYIYEQLSAATGADAVISVTLSIAFPNAQFFQPQWDPIFPVIPLSLSPAPFVAAKKKYNTRRIDQRAQSVGSKESYYIAQGASQSSYKSVVINSSGSGYVAPLIEGDAFDAKNEIDPTMSTAVGLQGSSPNASLSPPVAAATAPAPKLLPQTDRASTPKSRTETTMSGMLLGAAKSIAKPLFEKAVNKVGTALVGTNFQREPTGSMDLEGSNMDPILTSNVIHPNYVNACNTEPVYQLRRYPGSECYTTMDDFGSSVDEMRVDYLVRKPGWFANYTIPSTAASDAPVCGFPVHPTIPFCIGNSTSSFPLPTSAYAYTSSGGAIPWVAMLSSMSTYWTGDLEFTFRFTVGAFSTGKLLIVYTPGADPVLNWPPPHDLQEASSQYTLVYDLADQAKRITVRIPWMQPSHAMKTITGPNNDVPNFFGLGSALYNGFLQVIVLNPITTNAGSPSNVVMDVYVAAGPNFQLSAPSGSSNIMWRDDIIYPHNPWITAAPTVAATTAVAQGDEITTSAGSTDSNNWTNEAIVLVPKQREFTLAQISGERFASLRDLFKCRVPMFTLPPPESTWTPGSLSCYSIPTLLLSVGPMPVLSAFGGVRGSVRITIQANLLPTTAQSIPIAWTPWLADVCSVTSGSYAQSSTYFYSWFAKTTGSNVYTTSSVGFATNVGSTSGFGVKLESRSPVLTIEIPYNWLTRTYNVGALRGSGSAGPRSEYENPWGWFVFPTTHLADLTFWVGWGDDMRMGHLHRTPWGRITPGWYDTIPGWS